MTSQARRSLCVIVGSILAFLGAIAVRIVFADQFDIATERFHPVLIEESRSKAKCESRDERIFVETKLGTECIAYFVTKGFDQRRQAVFFFGGDARPQDFNDPKKL